jgi:patatin-like phospholipase/acyl hydrolase
VSLWGLGGIQWRPKQAGQKGLRILSFDGGGTRGVLSIAFLKELMLEVGSNKPVHELFDIICGTR